MAGTIKRAAAAVVIAGLVAGAVDIGVACVIYHGKLPVVLRAVSSGLLGRDGARAMGLEASFIGAGCQALIGLIAAAIYLLAGLRFPILFRRPLIGGLGFGVGVYLVMNKVVVPLSAAAPGSVFHGWLLIETWAANLLFGLIIALIVSGLMRGTAVKRAAQTPASSAS